ncbi:MAG: fibronectin type III domain-containing protein [Archangium sp.]|nr:fibronectin type III domain-containing protein [Archangium sp.]
MTRLLVAALCAWSVFASPAMAGQGQQVKRPRVTGGFGIGYLEYLPQDYDDRAPATYPVLIFMHGIGENGFGTESDLDRVLNNSGGPPVHIKNGAHFPFIVISGQHNANPNTDCWYASEINALVEHVKVSYRVDPNRIYLSALSCGAIGLWSFLNDSALRTKAAAVVSISGSGGSFTNSNRLDVPLWVFHGGLDGVVQACVDNGNVSALNRLTPPVVPFARGTFIAGQGHTGWSDVYGNSRPGCNVYEWLLTHAVGAPRVAVSVTVDGGTVGDPSVQLNGAPNATWCNTMSTPPVSRVDTFTAGSCVIVTAAPPDAGLVFDHWDTGGVAVDIPATASANFVMPSTSLALRPVYRPSSAPYVDTTWPKLWLTTPSAASSFTSSLATLTLAGTATDDVGVTQVTWVNSAGGSGTAVVPSGTTTMRAFRAAVALSAGVNTITFTARDAAGHTSTRVVAVTRGTVVNTAPSVNAGANGSVTLPNTYALQGTASDDGLPAALAVSWSKQSGPGTVTFTNGNTPTATAAFSAAGSYTLRLTATDTALTSVDDVVITVNSAPPVTYALTVTSGTGSGSYASGAAVTVVANAPPSGKVFDQWTATAGTLASATSATTTFTMPAAAATVTATYKNVPTYVLTVVRGSGGGAYPASAGVTVVANTPDAGQLFDRWTATAGTLASATSATTTFTMPAAAATVTATYKPVPTFALTVVRGSGSGAYAAGATVALTAAAPSAGERFRNWTASAGAVANPTSATSSFTMPASAATATANYEPLPTYSLTVTGGTGGGTFLAGATPSISANAPPSGKLFARWTGDVAALRDALAASTTVTMPAAPVTVAATYQDSPAPEVPVVSGFSVVDTETGAPLAEFNPLIDGATLNVANLPTGWNVRANTVGSAVGSVRFGLDGDASYRIESAAPYAIGGLSGPGQFAAWTLPIGEHTLQATPYTATGASGDAGATVSVRVHLVDEGGVAASPNAPTGLVATANDSSSIALDWDDALEADVTSYAVFRSLEVGFEPGEGTLAASAVTESRWQDTGLQPETTYVYRVVAVNRASAESLPSSEASATTLAAPPAEVTPRPSPTEAPSVTTVVGGVSCTSVGPELAGLLALAWLRRRRH